MVYAYVQDGMLDEVRRVGGSRDVRSSPRVRPSMSVVLLSSISGIVGYE